MNFFQSGLPHDPLIEKAFDLYISSSARMRPVQEEEMREKINNVFDRKELEIAQLLKMEKISAAEYDKYKDALEKQKVKFILGVPENVEKQVYEKITVPKMEAAKQLAGMGASPVAVAAFLMLEATRTPADFDKVQDTLGVLVGGVVSTLKECETYKTERPAILATAGNDARFLFLAGTTLDIEKLVEEAEGVLKQHPDAAVDFSDEQRVTLLEQAGKIWGADNKATPAFVATFNKLMDLVNGPVLLKVDAKGTPDIVPREKTPPKDAPKKETGIVKKPGKPDKPAGPGGFGGNVF